MYFIAHAFGFVSDVVVSNGVKRLRVTKDVREAMPFESVEKANEALQGATYGRHFCILNTFIEYTTPKVNHPAAVKRYEKVAATVAALGNSEDYVEGMA